MKKNKYISEPEFNELCKFVCGQLKPSGIKDLDIEALYFAIYWQICRILKEEVRFDNQFNYSQVNWHEKTQNLLDEQSSEKFNALHIIERNINECIISKYESFEAVGQSCY